MPGFIATAMKVCPRKAGPAQANHQTLLT